MVNKKRKKMQWEREIHKNKNKKNAVPGKKMKKKENKKMAARRT